METSSTPQRLPQQPVVPSEAASIVRESNTAVSMSPGTSSHPGPITRNLELEALLEAVRWPNAAPQTVLALVSQLLTARRDQDGWDTFRALAVAHPELPLFAGLAGFFQARLTTQRPAQERAAWLGEAISRLNGAVEQAPGLTTYFRGLAMAALPAELGWAETAVSDLEWMRAHRESFPPGLQRSVNDALARVHAAAGKGATQTADRAADADGPLFTTDAWLTDADGFHFVPPRLVELAPRIYVAQGYDFGEIAFVLTDAGIVVIDAGTTEANAAAALAALRGVTDLPLRNVILTHAHWDHIGGLNAFREAGVEVIAQSNYADELRIVNETEGPNRAFFGTRAQRYYDVTPDRLVDSREVLEIDGMEFVLVPVRGGETEDALLVHLPASGVLFVGDVIMPYLGAPFMPEGSAEELFAAMATIRALEPRLLIHGHPSLTESFPIEVFPALESALREVYQDVRQRIAAGQTLVEILHHNLLPDVLLDQPAAVMPFLVMRENVIKRLYHQRTGYWKPDGEGMETFTPTEWAAALDLLGGQSAGAFVAAGTALLDTRDSGLALRLIDAGLLRYARSRELAALRRRALDQLRERYQQLNPFKFILYSRWAGAELPLPESTVDTPTLGSSPLGRSSTPRTEGADVGEGWRG